MTIGVPLHALKYIYVVSGMCLIVYNNSFQWLASILWRLGKPSQSAKDINFSDFLDLLINLEYLKIGLRWAQCEVMPNEGLKMTFWDKIQ